MILEHVLYNDLFAIVSDLSMKAGYDGFVYAEAMDEELLRDYASVFGKGEN